MELYIVFFMIIAVALIVLAIYITKVESLAVTNRTRIANIEKGSSEQYVYNKAKLIEENKSLSFQLAEVSKALQEKKLLIYEMDEKLSKMDAELGKTTLQLEGKSKGLANASYRISDLTAAYEECKASRKDYVDLVLRPGTVIGDKPEDLTLGEAPKYGKSPIYEALKSIEDSNSNRRWVGVDFGNEPDQSARPTYYLADGKNTPFALESEELKGFNMPTISWDMPKSKPIIDAEFVTQDYGESERIEAPHTEDLHDHTGSDPIFEADCKDADQAANSEFYHVSTETKSYGSKTAPVAQNIPKTEEASALIWWTQQPAGDKSYYASVYGNSPYALLENKDIIRAYNDFSKADASEEEPVNACEKCVEEVNKVDPEFTRYSAQRYSETQCRNCGKELGLRDKDAGSDKEVNRLCDPCADLGESMRIDAELNKNIPLYQEDHLIWWKSLTLERKLELAKNIKAKITFDQIKQIWYDETGGDLE